MEILFEIFKNILPAIIAGMFTFFITKYTYSKNIPLDKLEIAYNRIYYPIYMILSNKENNNDINYVINKSRLYLNKYKKYADRSTLAIFDSLCRCNKNAKRKSIYKIFKNNIYDKNSYLRRRLGYLEPNPLQMYKYSSSSDKSSVRVLLEFLAIYILIWIGGITDYTKTVCAYIIAVLMIILFIEIICKFIVFIYFLIKK